MAEWKKIIVSGSQAELAGVTGSFTGSFTGDGTGLTGLATNLNIADGDSGTDIVNLVDDTLSFVGTANEIETAVTDNTVTIGLPDDVIIAGNLTVTGTTTQLQVTNLNVDDQFILLNSHSADTAVSADGGIIVQTSGSTADGALGTALFYDNDTNRWALAQSSSVLYDTTDATPDQYVVSVETAAGVPTAPSASDFGTTAESQYGMMYVNTTAGDDGGLYIYLPD
jgi:hypothetical protein